MSKHTANWQVKSVVTLPDGSKMTSITWGRTRADARAKARDQHRLTPHGVSVTTQNPVKVTII